MIKHSQRQTGSALVVLIIVIVVAIIGALGWVAWNNFFVSSNDSQLATETQQVDAKPCGDDDAIMEKDGFFCSDQIGIRLAIPGILAGKFQKTDNYEIFKGTVDYTTRASAGNSDVVYTSVLAGSDNFTLTIAKEPLRSGYVDVAHANQSTYYDKGTGVLSNVTSPTKSYDSTNDTYVTSGSYAVASPVPSFEVAGTKIYHASVGDAGTRIETYFMVINSSIVKIKLTNNGYMGAPENDPTTIDAAKIFDEFDASVKKIELIRP